MPSKDDHSELYAEILKLKTIEEAEAFFSDLCTYNELDAMESRVRAAKLILKGETFVEVMEKTKISSATLARVSKAIKHGEGGYKLILEREKKK